MDLLFISTTEYNSSMVVDKDMLCDKRLCILTTEYNSSMLVDKDMLCNKRLCKPASPSGDITNTNQEIDKP